MKPKIKIFVTKSYKLRARVDDGKNPTYEVTIGSEGWRQGKASAHRQVILDKARNLVNKVSDDLNNVISNGW